jgi:hypothetical protein
MRKKKSYYTLEHLIKREWNTCVSARSDENGALSFSGFYGDYEVEVRHENTCVKKKATFDKNESSFLVELD